MKDFWQGQALALLLVLLTLNVAVASPLSNKETDGFLQWHHSLETTVTARLSAETEEGNLLYPFDLPGWELAEVKPYRHLAISKAIMELEAQWLLRGENREESALVALAHARNYTNLSEYDSAMVWYQAAARLDTLGLFRQEIAGELMAVSSAANDTLGMEQLITNTLGASDLQGRERELVLAYRWLVTNRDSETLELLLAKAATQPELETEQLIFWRAYSLSWLEKREACLETLKKLIKSGSLSQGLTEGQRTWVLAAIPDLLFLLDENYQARSLYATMKNSKIDMLRIWSTYQLANLDFLGNHYSKAANGFDLVCEARRLGTWQDQACAMATISRRMETIRSEGEPYGTAQYYKP